jgi:hypothetical protein
VLVATGGIEVESNWDRAKLQVDVGGSRPKPRWRSWRRMGFSGGLVKVAEFAERCSPASTAKTRSIWK